MSKSLLRKLRDWFFSDPNAIREGDRFVLKGECRVGRVEYQPLKSLEERGVTKAKIDNAAKRLNAMLPVGFEVSAIHETGAVQIDLPDGETSYRYHYDNRLWVGTGGAHKSITAVGYYVLQYV